MIPANVTLDATTVLAAPLGLAVGVGLLLVIIGWRGVDPNRQLRRIPLRRIRDAVTRDPRRAVRIAVAVAAGALTVVITSWVVGAALAGLAVWALLRVLSRDPEHACQVARIEAIATWTEMLRDTLSAASGLEQAILATAPLAPKAIRDEITKLSTRIENGDRLAPSLHHLADDLADPTGDLVIAALVLASEQQARQLGDLLGSLAQAAREQASMRMRIEAGRAPIRTAVRVIVGTTLAFAVTVLLLNQSYRSTYDTLVGQVVLLAIGALFALGFAWLVRIATIPKPDRVLISDPDTAAAMPETIFAPPERQV